jgi:hypothetical protein
MITAAPPRQLALPYPTQLRLRSLTPNPHSNKPSRNLGPDKPSRHGRGKAKSEFKAERGPKGPMREVVRGRFFGEVDDDDDDYDEEANEDNFDAGVSDSEKDA